MKSYTVRVSEQGDRYWYLNNRRHREEGPAVEWCDGTKEWFLDGIQYSESEWNKKLHPAKEMTDEEKFVLALKLLYELKG